MLAEEAGRLGGFERYKDVDGDGIRYRTLPGIRIRLAAWFARGSGHNEKAIYSERPDVYVNNIDRLDRKFETARESPRRLSLRKAPRRARRRLGLLLMEPATDGALRKVSSN